MDARRDHPDRRDHRDRRDRRGRRRSTTLLVLTIVLAAGALAATAAALGVRSDTSSLEAQTTPLQKRVQALSAGEDNAERRLRTLRERSETAAARLGDLLTAYQAQV